MQEHSKFLQPSVQRREKKTPVKKYQNLKREDRNVGPVAQSV